MSGQWDVAFKLVLERLFALVGLSLQTEWTVGDLPLRIDGVVRCQPDDVARLAERTPFGFFARHNLLECKSFADRLTLDEFQRIVGRAYLYAANEKVRNHNDLVVCILCAHCPRRLLRQSQAVAQFACAAQGIYVTRSVGIPVYIVVVPELPAEPSTVFLRLFGDAEGRREAIATFIGWGDPELIRVSALLFPEEVHEVMKMMKRIKAPDIAANVAYLVRWLGPEKVIGELTPEERLAGLKPEERLVGLKPEE
ncbi:MAG: hypothetical protein NZT92_21815, partial [Abditibacteriales bacterium]|nr:hypothetical protein [Abditibacteriales bacterium]